MLSAIIEQDTLLMQAGKSNLTARAEHRLLQKE